MLKFGFSWGVFLTFVFISEYVSAMESDSCFKKEDENWGVWNGNCTGSEVLVVPTQELNVTVDGMHVNKLAQNLTYSFGGCSMTVWYQPQAGSFTYNSIAVGFPLDITITPNQITLKSSTVSKVDCSSTPVQFEKISGGNKIEINYKPENASEAYFKMKYNAGLYDGLSKETTDIAWILFIVGLVLFVLLLMSVIVLVVILVRLKNAEKKLDEQQPIETPINESKFSTAVGNEDMKTTPTTGGTGDTKITATLINTAEPNKAHPRTVETTIKSADLRTAEPKNSVEKMALKPRAMILDEKAKYIGQGHKVGMDDYPTVSLNYVNLIRLVFVWMDDVVSDFDVTVTAQEATKAKTAENKKKLKRTMSNENFTFNPVNKPLRSQEKKTLGNID